MKLTKRCNSAFCLIFIIVGSLYPIVTVKAAQSPYPTSIQADPSQQAPDLSKVYLPIITSPIKQIPTVNAPFFDGNVIFGETAILWFGQVTSNSNYADVRVGYNSTELYIRVGVFDRLLWYDTKPDPYRLTAWDAVSVFLDTGGNSGNQPGRQTYRLTGQLNWWEPRGSYQASFRGNGTGWDLVSLPFSTTTGYRGNAPNDMTGDQGWSIDYHIPFSSLGLNGPPPQGTRWGLGLSVYNRNDSAGTALANQTWPTAMNPDQSLSWGELRFGLPVFIPPAGVTPKGVVTIRNKLNGVQVVDSMVGGATECGAGLNPWTDWGKANYATAYQVNVQNEADVSDFPCFSKFYITFPLDSLPVGKEIISATLTLYQIGNAGGGQYGSPPNSLVQVLSIGQDWQKTTLNWNNAPLPLENVSLAWVEPISSIPPSTPGIPRKWDLSYAVQQAYVNHSPLRIALYSADSDYNSGRYFLSSNASDYEETGRPTLEIQWGEP